MDTEIDKHTQTDRWSKRLKTQIGIIMGKQTHVFIEVGRQLHRLTYRWKSKHLNEYTDRHTL
jgi:hypothetical protein